MSRLRKTALPNMRYSTQGHQGEESNCASAVLLFSLLFTRILFSATRVDGHSTKAINVPLLRHLQTGQQEAPRGLLKMPWLCQTAMQRLCYNAQSHEGRKWNHTIPCIWNAFGFKLKRTSITNGTCLKRMNCVQFFSCFTNVQCWKIWIFLPRLSSFPSLV